MNFMDPQLRPVLDKNSIEIPGGSGGGNLQSIGNGRYAVTLPDGTQVIVDPHLWFSRCQWCYLGDH